MTTETAASTAAKTDKAPDAAHDDDHSHGLSNLGYVKIALALAIITGIEVAASYSPWLGRAYVPLILFLMAVKFITVVSYFMHLKFDNRLFSTMFYMGLVLAIAVYMATMFTFKFFSP